MVHSYIETWPWWIRPPKSLESVSPTRWLEPWWANRGWSELSRGEIVSPGWASSSETEVVGQRIYSSSTDTARDDPATNHSTRVLKWFTWYTTIKWWQAVLAAMFYKFKYGVRARAFATGGCMAFIQACLVDKAIHMALLNHEIDQIIEEKQNSE